MAIEIPSIFPVDTTPDIGVGVGLPFSGGEDPIFTTTYTTSEAIRANIINFFLTNKGERPFRPNFGANLRADIFQAASESDYDLLKEKIAFEMGNNFPNVNLDEVSILGSEDLNTIRVTISYSIKSFGLTDEVTLTFV